MDLNDIYPIAVRIHECERQVCALKKKEKKRKIYRPRISSVGVFSLKLEEKKKCFNVTHCINHSE